VVYFVLIKITLQANKIYQQNPILKESYYKKCGQASSKGNDDLFEVYRNII